jgi:N-acetylmuramoyl-L-alanine amidase
MKLKEKNIKYIVVHCSDTPDSPKSKWYNIGVETIEEWHKSRFKPVCDNGVLKHVGYHYIIKKNGEIDKGRSEGLMGQHASDYNWRSIGICLIGRGEGTFDPNKFYESAGGINDLATPEQIATLRKLLSTIQTKYGIPVNNIIGHHDTYPMLGKKMNKPCPSFSVHKWLTGEYFSWEQLK